MTRLGCVLSLAGLLLVVLGAIPATSKGATSYSITKLAGSSGESFAYASAINDRGQVVGGSYGTYDNDRGFIYDNGAITVLGVLPTGIHSYATAINNHGDVVGYANVNGHYGKDHAFLYQAGAMIDLGVLPNGEWSRATGINDAGVITGSGSGNVAGDSRAFIRDANGMRSIGLLSGGHWSFADAINNSGMIAGGGDAYGTDGFHRAFVYDGTTKKTIPLLPGGTNNAASAINNLGHVAGMADYGAFYEIHHAILFNGSTARDLGVLPGTGDESYARGINDFDHVVGSSEIASGIRRAFMHDGQSMKNLNDLIAPGSGWVLTTAADINNLGQIVGTGTFDSDGPGSLRPVDAAYLLTPLPEPSGIAAAAVSVTMMCRRRRKQ